MQVYKTKYSDKVIVIKTDDGKEINIYIDGRNIQLRTHAGDFNTECVHFAYPED